MRSEEPGDHRSSAELTADSLPSVEQMLATALKIEEATKQLFQANETAQTDMLKATALRLRAEADLKREQISASYPH